MALQLGLRPVDHPDEALEPRLQQPEPRRPVVAERQQEAPDAGVVADPLVAVGPEGRTVFTSIAPSQSEAAATVPAWVPKPISATSSPQRPRASWPMLSSPRTAPMPVARASPRRR